MAKTIFRFSIFGLSLRLCRGSEVTVGSEDQLQNFLKGVFVQERSSGTCFDHGQFEVKTFPIYAPPYYIYPYGRQRSDAACHFHTVGKTLGSLHFLLQTTTLYDIKMLDL